MIIIIIIIFYLIVKTPEWADDQVDDQVVQKSPKL